MKILITGANGFVAWHLTKTLMQQGFEVFLTGNGAQKNNLIASDKYFSADITEKEKIKEIVKIVAPNVLIHTAAISKPDVCEQNHQNCINVNVNGTQNLLESAKLVGAHFIFFSTDFVLGNDGPHREDAPMQPLNFYGVSKQMAEEYISSTSIASTIIRPVFVYGEISHWSKNGFLQWVQQQLVSGIPIKVVKDQLRTPTFVNDVCSAVLAIILQKQTGLFHIAGTELLTPYDMAINVAQFLQLPTSLIHPVTADTFEEIVKRPHNGGLINQKAIEMLQWQPTPFLDALPQIFKQL